MSDFKIQHQPEESLFFVPLDDGQSALLKYRLSGSESAEPQIDIFSTYVPDSYRNKGLALQLVECAFDWADQQKMHINTSCWYAAKILKRR